MQAPASIPARFDPGEAYRFDWDQEDVILAGTATRVHIAHLRLCYSHMFLVQAYPRQTREMLCDARERAFRYFGGASPTGIYNHSKPSAKRLVGLSKGKFKPDFLKLCEHFAIRPAACTPDAIWPAGRTERQLHNVRQSMFFPSPEAGSFPELNARLADRCRSTAGRLSQPSDETRTLRERFEMERPHLPTLGQPLDDYRQVETTASLECLGPFDQNWYSVHARAAGQRVEVCAHVDRVTVHFTGVMIADHARDYRQGRIIYDPHHYLPALDARPCAVWNGAPFRDWQLPGAIGEIHHRLARHPDSDRRLVAILSKIPEWGMDAVEAACETALLQGDCSPEGMERILTRAGGMSR